MDCSGIYAIQRKDSDECYIGSAVNVTKRWRAHRLALSHGKHRSRHMQSVFNKHGAEAFEFSVIEHVADKENLLAREQVWLDRFSPVYNTATVAGSSLGLTRSDETRAKMSEAKRGKKHAPHSAAARAKMSASRKARPPASAESCAKMSAAMVGNTRLTGHKHSADSRAKMSATHKARWAKTREAA